MKELDLSTSSEKKTITRHDIDGDIAVEVNIENDLAIHQLASMVVAGVDKKHSLHPSFEAHISTYGEKKARDLIEHSVEIEGACDVMQTEMNVDGLPGLFGGLSKDGDRFIFYEWLPLAEEQMCISMTIEDARAIVKGEKNTIWLLPAQQIQK